jgi:hypothetical protein
MLPTKFRFIWPSGFREEFLIGRFLKIFFSETALPNEPKVGSKHPWQGVYKDC